MVLGAIIAGYDSLGSESAQGYLIAIANNFTSSLVYVITSVYDERKVVNAFDLTFFFGLIGLPVTLGISSWTGQLVPFFWLMKNGMEEVTVGSHEQMILLIMTTGSLGMLILMTQLLCVSINGSLSISITGVFKDVGLTFIGFLLFDDTEATTNVILGLTISFIGAIYYCVMKYQKSTQVESKKINKVLNHTGNKTGNPMSNGDAIKSK